MESGWIALALVAAALVFGFVVGSIIGKKAADYNNKNKMMQ